MAYDNMRTVSAFYDTRDAAIAHKRQLEAIGVLPSDITIVEGANSNEPSQAYEEKGFFEAIGDFLMGDDDREVYNEGLKRGGHLLTARVADAHYSAALQVLDTDDAIDMDARSEDWRSDGWEGIPERSVGYPNRSVGYGAADTVAGQENVNRQADTGVRDGNVADGTIEVVEENVRIGKRDVSHGRVRVRSYVVEDQVSEDVSLHSEHVEIERRPVDRAIEPGTAAFQDRTIEAEETAEEVVVSKEARVVEEIDLKKRSDDATETVTETVRHTEVDIDDGRDGETIDRKATRNADYL